MADVEPAAKVEEPKEVTEPVVENANPVPEESIPEKVDEDNKSKKKVVGWIVNYPSPSRIHPPRSAQPWRIRGLVCEVGTDH